MVSLNVKELDDILMRSSENIRSILEKPIVIKEYGPLVTTLENLSIMTSHIDLIAQSFERYIRGDWGDTNVDDAAMNELALKGIVEARIRAIYKFPDDDITILIFTEWDRSVTKIFFKNDN